MAPQNPDLDARFAVFMNPIRDLTKNWEVDIAKYLEDYLSELAEVQITFDDGHTVMNFAEAAMLIQGSATVYSKKVEFLWQMVLQMIDLLSTKKEINQNTAKDGRQRTTKQNTTLDFESIDDLSSGRNIELKEEDDDDDDSKPFCLLPSVPLHLVEKESEKFAKIALHLKNFEAIGYKDDFRVNRCYVSPLGLLSLNLPQEIPNLDCDINKSRCGFNAGSFSPLRSEPQSPPKHNIDSEYDDQEMDQRDDIDDFIDNNAAYPDEDKNDLKENLPTKSEDDGEPASVEKGQKLRSRAPKNNEEVSLKDPLKPLDPHIETPAKRPVRMGRIRKPAPCNCHKQPAKTTSRLKKKALKEKLNIIASDQATKERLSIEELIGVDIADMVLNNNDHKLKNKLAGSFPIDPRIVHELANEEIKKSDLLKAKKVREILASKAAADGNLREAELLTKEADVLMQHMEDDQINHELDDDVPNLDFDDVGANSDLELPAPHKDIVTMYGVMSRGDDEKASAANRSFNDTLFYEPSSDYEALVQRWVADYLNNAQEQVSSTELTRRVNQWRKHINPILADEQDRKAFNIHDYGSKVLSRFSDGGDIVPFKNMVEGDESREVARTFLSCLMLANTNNIELNLSRLGPLQMDCLDLSLLSRERHHERIEEVFTGDAPNRKRSQGKRKSSTSPCASPDRTSSSPSTKTGKRGRKTTSKFIKRTRIK